MSAAYYRVGDKYWDNAANILYRCTTAGDKTSSVWVPVGGGIIWTGEYDPTKAYSLACLAIVSLGANAGTYIYNSTTPSTGTAGANPTASPWLGGSWVQLPNNALGNWM